MCGQRPQPNYVQESLERGGSAMTFEQMIENSGHIVFFGGAGVSTASGIPDFRGAEGIGGRKAEEVLSHSFFINRTEEFFEFYRKHMLFPNAVPNAAHYALAELERRGKLKAVITQNVDGLHRRAGSNIVYELHGNVDHNYCMECGKAYGAEYVMRSRGIPRCACGGVIKPDVVLYGEPLDLYMLRMSNAYAMAAQMLIVAGTSLSVFPANEIVDSYMHNRLVIINDTPTEFDQKADLIIRDKVETVLGRLLNK